MKDKARKPAKSPWPLCVEIVADSEPPYWGRSWTERFAACFAKPPDVSETRAAEEIKQRVIEALGELPELERQIIEDYYIRCLPRRQIGARQGLAETEVNAVRAHAERKLQGLLAGYVYERFGVRTPVDSDCPLCTSPQRSHIDHLLRERTPQIAWGVLRRQMNEQFGLNIRRVQVIMTHCRFHLHHSPNRTEEIS